MDPVNTPVLLDSSQEQALWEDAIRTSSEDCVLLNIPQTAAAAARAWDLLHDWEVPLDRNGFERSADCEAFHGWMQAVSARLRENGWITRSELPGVLAKQVAMGSSPNYTSIATAGLDDPAPAVARLLRALDAKRRPEAEVSARVGRVELNDTAAELTAAAWWARHRLEASPDGRIGVIVHGLAGLAAETERIFDDILHPSFGFQRSVPRAFHLSAGMPSSEVPLISAALLVLQLVDALTLAEAGTLLRSPFVAMEPAGRLECDYRLRLQGVDRVSIHLGIMRRCFPELARVAGRLPVRQRPWQWSSVFSKMLEAGRWLQGRTLSPTEHRAVKHWNDLLSQFAHLDLVLPELTLPQALEQLREMTARSRFTLPEQDAPVQILDVAGAAGARFDALWVAGMHAGAWPPPAQPHPFLPLALQRRLGMPDGSPERAFERGRALTERLCGAAPEVIFSSPAMGTDETLRVSPLLQHLPVANEALFTDDGVLARVFASGVALEECSWGQASALADGTKQKGGVKLLERQAACPFQAFAVHRLGARELGEPPLGVSAMERGSLAHKALEHFWNQVKTQRALLQLTAAGRAEIVNASVRQALDDGLGPRCESTGMARFRQIEEERMCRLIEEWLGREGERRPFEVVRSEHEETISLGGLALSVRADRVDQYEDSRRHAIIDYKTSNNLKSNQWEGARPDAPQLPLYAVTSLLPIEEIAFARLVPRATKLLSDTQAAEHIPAWRGVLEKLAADFRSGRADVDPKDGGKPCKLCPLTPLCRVRESGSASMAEEMENGDA